MLYTPLHLGGAAAGTFSLYDVAAELRNQQSNVELQKYRTAKAGKLVCLYARLGC